MTMSIWWDGNFPVPTPFALAVRPKQGQKQGQKQRQKQGHNQMTVSYPVLNSFLWANGYHYLLHFSSMWVCECEHC